MPAWCLQELPTEHFSAKAARCLIQDTRADPVSLGMRSYHERGHEAHLITGNILSPDESLPSLLELPRDSIDTSEALSKELT